METYSRLVLKEKFPWDIRHMKDWDQGGVLQPEEANNKAGYLFIEVIWGKYTMGRIPKAHVLEEYDDNPLMICLHITEEVIDCVAWTTYGGVGMGGGRNKPD